MEDRNTRQELQETADKFLIRHKSILDTTSKMQEYCARVNRAIAKAVTCCGCIKIDADKQCLPPDANYSDIRAFMQSHLNGALCDNCRDTISHEIGTTVFYLAALCNLLELDLDTVINEEDERIRTLGIYSLK